MDDIRRTSSFKHSKSLALLVAVLASNLLLIRLFDLDRAT